MSMIVYLHGFASGPSSTKGRYFAGRFAEHGIELVQPDLVPDFESITLSAQLEVIDTVVAGSTVRCLIGSSMGGYLAALYAATHPSVERVLCLAPAFDFAARWAARIGPDAMAKWRDSGRLPVFHYGLGRTADVGYGLYTDSLQFDAYPAVAQPVLVAHGVHDDVVPVELSREFVRRAPHAGLREFDSDHQLINVLPELWDTTWEFVSR